MTHILNEQLNRQLKFPMLFQVLLDEDVNQPMLDEFTMTLTDKVVGPYLYNLVTVLSVKQIDDDYYGLITVRDKIVGWTQLKNSLYVFPKRAETVKINHEKLKISSINERFKLGTKSLRIFKTQLLLTKGYVFQDGIRYELIYMKGKLTGLIEAHMLYRSYPVNLSFSIDNQIEIYKDSNLKVKLRDEVPRQIVEADLFFPDLKLLKFKMGEKYYWLETNQLDIDFNDHMSHDESQDLAKELFESERVKSKRVIEMLLKEQRKLLRENRLQQRRIEFLERKEVQFENLRKSKLGRIQVGIWNRLRRK